MLLLQFPTCCWERNAAMFWDDTEHYRPLPNAHQDPEEVTLESFKAFHRRHHLSRFHKYDNTKSIPYSYILVKAKDINRSRPIVSYYHHPLKRTFNYASRGLTHILKQSNMKSFTLWSCKSMTATLKQFQKQLGTAHGPNTRIMAYCADIKNMYTSLPHDAIIDAIRFAIQHCRDTNRRARRRLLGSYNQLGHEGPSPD